MLNDATCFNQIFIVCGFTDLRSGIDTLASIVSQKTGSTPYVPDTLYLFCGRRSDRIKGLVWEKDGFLLLYKRLEQGKFIWPRNEEDVKSLTSQQFRWLMEGLTIEPRKSVRPVEPPEYVA
jgi:transposase